MRARERWTISISLLITLVVSMTALYVTFTPMRSLSVDGFQGRYLFPLIILAPVSYTHLDVYKRQLLHAPQGEERFHLQRA